MYLKTISQKMTIFGLNLALLLYLTKFIDLEGHMMAQYDTIVENSFLAH